MISADLDLLAQTMPGDKLRFQAVTVEEAHQALREQKTRSEKIWDRLAGS